jgi:hypothetical protein
MPDKRSFSMLCAPSFVPSGTAQVSDSSQSSDSDFFDCENDSYCFPSPSGPYAQKARLNSTCVSWLRLGDAGPDPEADPVLKDDEHLGPRLQDLHSSPAVETSFSGQQEGDLDLLTLLDETLDQVPCIDEIWAGGRPINVPWEGVDSASPSSFTVSFPSRNCTGAYVMRQITTTQLKLICIT